MPRKAKRRKPGQGSVHLRKDGRWEGRHVIGYNEKGSPITKSVMARSKAECITKLKALQEQCGVLKSDKVKPDMPFGDWIDYWYQHYSKPTVRATTQSSYESYIYDYIIPGIGSIPLNKLTQNNLQQFYTAVLTNGRKEKRELYGPGLSNAIVRHIHLCCRMALEKAVKDSLISKNCAIGCKLPPKKAKEMQVLTHDEMKRFLLQAREEGYYELFLLELSTGLRRGEISALQWDDFNEKTGALRIDKQLVVVGGKVQISTPKTKTSIRTILLPPAVVRVLQAYHTQVHSVWMFPSRVDETQPMNPGALYSVLKRILQRSQCKDIRFHDLRHTFATAALEYGMDIKTLSTVLGHVSSATTLNIYSHVTDSMQQAAARKIEKGIVGTQAPAIPQGDPNKKKGEVIFLPYKGKTRRPGTGCVRHISPNVWEGRYSPVWPDGKVHARILYAHSQEECERMLAEMIVQVKEEILLAKASVTDGVPDADLIPDGISKKEKAVREYMLAHPEETNISKIARECGVCRATAKRYYNRIHLPGLCT